MSATTHPAIEAAPWPDRSVAVVRPGRVSGLFLGGLLLVCLFAPYGLLPYGGGTLRPDHVAIYVAFAYALFRGQLTTPPVLAKALFGFVVVAIIGTILQLAAFQTNPLQSMKYLDGLMRGPIVLTIAASMAPTERNSRIVVRTVVLAVAGLAFLAAAERLLPRDHAIVSFSVIQYGGPAYDFGVYRDMGWNHKSLLLMVDRASAVFVTAPSLAMAGVFCLCLAAVGGRTVDRLSRILLVCAAMICGLASNSKSFILGVPLLGLLLVLFAPNRMRALVPGAFGIGFAGLLNWYATRETGSELAWNPLQELSAQPDKLAMLSAGRFSEKQTILDVSAGILAEHPLFGFGVAHQTQFLDSDSGINKFVLHGGLIGSLVAFTGIVLQLVWFYQRRGVERWAATGFSLLILGVSYFLAGAVFQMPRINDLLFVLLGLSIAHASAATQAAEPTAST